MLKRYRVAAMDKIWSLENKYQVWLKIEQLIAEAWTKLGVIPTTDLKALQTLKVDLPRMDALETVTKHDVVAFTRMLSEQIGLESRWIHLGVTSTDIVDTAQNFLIKEANNLIAEALEQLLKTLKHLAFKYQNQLVMGRTHGMYGEPTALGLKFALWYEEIKRQKERFVLARKQIEVAKISGSMGNYANLEPEIETYVADKLGLGLDPLSTQVTQRDRHAFLISVFANFATTFEKITTEIRLLQRSDVGELAEGFSEGQKGSSSMPHKKNPISSENIAGLSRYLRTFVPMVLENNNLWHERDISHSSNERLLFPDFYHILLFVLRRLNSTLENLYVDSSQMLSHLESAKNVYFSQPVLTTILIKNAHVKREEVYDFIQSCAQECLTTKTDFEQVLLKNGIQKYLDPATLHQLFDQQFFLRHVQQIYKRIF